MLSNPGPSFTTSLLRAEHEKLIFFLGPGDLALLFFVVSVSTL